MSLRALFAKQSPNGWGVASSSLPLRFAARCCTNPWPDLFRDAPPRNDPKAHVVIFLQ
jgi:hypothetical protein